MLSCIKCVYQIGTMSHAGNHVFFLSLWTYLWLSFNFSVHFLPVGLINKDGIFFSAVLIHTRNILNFLFGYKTNCPKFILAQKLDPLRRGTEIHCHMQCWPLHNFYWYPLLGDKGWHLHKQLSSKCRSSEYPYTPLASIFPVLHPLYSTQAYPLLDLTRAWTLLKEVIKCGQCFKPGLTHFYIVDAFIIHIFLLL